MNKLNINQSVVESCRKYAKIIANDVQSFIDQHTTVSVERATLRLLGVDGTDEFQVPLPNRIVDDIVKNGNISLGVSTYLASALKSSGLSLSDFLIAYKNEEVNICGHEIIDQDATFNILKPYYDSGLKRILENKAKRTDFLTKFPREKTDIYVIVATGNIDEDVIQAVSAAEAGADIIAVIRSTGQSLLDYVPYGKTTEGFGGTFATQENFKIMRKALDEVSFKLGRYIYLVNYASGLCMPEIAAMGALERLDVLLNDSMYGIIFRDINMQRTFVDQYFSRLINAYAGIIINTGEDNYLTTSDAVEEAHTVTASQFINEAFAKKAHLPSKLMGLGHAFEIDPEVEDSFLLELSQAQLAREIFPDAPLKYMPPTKHINGNIFKAYQQNVMFNMVTTITGQSIHLLGMMTEAIHTPYLSDRYLAIKNAKMIQKSMKSLGDEISYKPEGIIQKRAVEVLNSAEKLLKQIAEDGMFNSLAKGVFAQTKRSENGGKGLSGVFRKNKNYVNVVLEKMEESFNEN
ncbi:MAG: lysine 5,6-aminomutase subunit alpha [Candidatus Izemoplasmatales bacterium]|nr:lysine 5,6-aminomutase subunit alpha [Candidatus Izemoplasmatales bacterium]